MTWVCPSCGNRYPDSGIGLPSEADAIDKTYCEGCAVNPNDLRELIEEWRATAHETRHKTVRQGKILHHFADELEDLL